MPKTKVTQDKIKAVGWRLILKPREIEEKTSGGIYLPEQVKDIEQFAEVVLQVVDVGPDAYQGDRFGVLPWVEKGDWVVVARHAGWRIQIPGSHDEFRVVNDDEIIAVVDGPDALG